MIQYYVKRGAAFRENYPRGFKTHLDGPLDDLLYRVYLAYRVPVVSRDSRP